MIFPVDFPIFLRLRVWGFEPICGTTAYRSYFEFKPLVLLLPSRLWRSFLRRLPCVLWRKFGRISFRSGFDSVESVMSFFDAETALETDGTLFVQKISHCLNLLFVFLNVSLSNKRSRDFFSLTILSIAIWFRRLESSWLLLRIQPAFFLPLTIGRI